MKTEVLSRSDIDKIIHQAFDGEQVQVLNYHLERFSTDKVGFLGSHQSLEIIVKRRDNSESTKYRFFIKSIPPFIDVQLQFIREKNIFGREALYFNDILPLLRASCPNSEEWSPKCLLATDEFVVLEDMSLRNYAMSKTKMLNEKQLHAAFKAQARLHAASLVAEKQLGKPLHEACSKNCPEEVLNENIVYYKCLDLYTDLAEKVAKRLDRDSPHFRAGFRKGIDQLYDRSKLSTKLPKVLVHGDAWSNNYLFDADDPTKCIIVDYQWIRYGQPMCDTVQLAYLSTARELRDRVIRKAIEAYYKEFCEVLDKNDPEIKRPTLEDFLEEYEELRLTALLYAFMYYPVIWLGKSIIDKYGEEEHTKRFVFRQDNSFVMQAYDEDKLFAARINEVIEEAVEYFERRSVLSTELNNGLH